MFVHKILPKLERLIRGVRLVEALSDWAEWPMQAWPAMREMAARQL